MTNVPLDISQLALDRSDHGDSSRIRPRRIPWFARYLLPIGILLGFVALLGVSAGWRFLPPTSVTVIPVILKPATLRQQGTTLFQSPGWIEPRPTAISVAALAPGVIEELLVVEGQEVTKGDAIARLISIDAELNVQQAKNTLAIRAGELNRAQAELAAAKIRVASPVHLHVQLADAQSTLAKAQTELAKLPFLLTTAEANEQYTRNNMEGKRSAGEAIPGRIVALAEKEHAAAHAELQELRSRIPNLEREVDTLTAKVNAIKRQIELLVEETRQVQEAMGKLQAAEANRNEAKLQVRQAELALERNVVRAPMDGRILRLIAAPGTRVMGLKSTSGHSASTVVEMYDPNRLQVRADVRLEDVPMVTRGQPVEIETASTKGVLHGRVLQMTSSANIQKNTLEVKVELLNPPPTVSPEMLVTATFLAPALATNTSDTIATERMFVPSQLIQSGESGDYVWIVDENSDAQLRSVELGSPFDDGLIEIQSGLYATDKLIASGIDRLKPGGPVAVTGDDQFLGMH